jgi:signal transduction histidine kinase/class 3 adenylate cyclase
VLVVSLIGVLGLLATTILTIQMGQAQVHRRLDLAANQAARNFDNFFVELRSDLKATAASLAMSRDAKDLLRSAIGRNRWFLDLMLVAPDGEVVMQRHRFGRPVVSQIEERPWEGIGRGEVYIGEVRWEGESQVVDMAVGYTDDIGLRAGTLVARADLTELWRVTLGISVGKAGFVYVTDHRGRLVAYRDRAVVRQVKTLSELMGLGPEDIVSSDRSLITGLEGNRAFVSGQRLEAVPWFAIVEQPAAEILTPYLVPAGALGVAGIGVLWLMFSILRYTHQRVVLPLARSREAVAGLTGGDFSRTISVQHDDELGALAVAFNTMSRQLERSFADLESKNAELQKHDQLKDAFLANTSHELRTPLNGIIGIADSMLEGAAGTLSPSVEGNIRLIVASGRRLFALVDDLLDFSKLRHQTVELRLRSVDVRAVAELVLMTTGPLASSKELQLVNAVPEHMPLVQADEGRLQQILYNLVGNAIKFTEEGAVTLRAEIVGEFVAVSIIDTGIGIDPEKHEAIFESFEQGDGSTARAYGGTGLGLAISRQLIALHGGEIYVQSAPGEGATFTFTLPLADAALDEPTFAAVAADALELVESAPEPAKQPATEPSHLLMVVDDDPVNRQVLTNYLRVENFDVAVASSGAEALALIEEGPLPDLILMDVMMPHMTGLDVTRRLREEHPQTLLPIMMLTAKNQPADVVAGLEAGANDYLSKPFAKDELFARIRTHLNIRRLLNEKDHLRRTFGRYVTDAVVSSLLDRAEGLDLGGERRTLTMLTSDLRGFSSMAERSQPEEVVRILNFYLEHMADVITQYGGVIDEFMGDGIFVLFGAPEASEDDPERAVACALAMQLAMQGVNETLSVWGFDTLDMGIGVHTGDVVVGNIGSEKRTKYGVVGSHVNLTFRIESFTTGGQVLISEATLREVGASKLQIGETLQVHPKGASQPIRLFDVVGVGAPHDLTLARQEASYQDVPTPHAVRFAALVGAQIDEDVRSAVVRRVSRRAVVFSLDDEGGDAPPVLSNLWISLEHGGAEHVTYGKVLRVDEQGVEVRLTSRTPGVEDWLATMRGEA